MTSPQQPSSHSHLPKYYWYGYPSTPSMNVPPRTNVLGLYSIASPAASPPENAARGDAGMYGSGPPAASPVGPAYAALGRPAPGEPQSPPSRTYAAPQFALGTTPPTLSPLESPLSSPHFYYGQYAPLVASRPADASPPGMYASTQLAQASPPQVVAANAAPPGATSPYYARQSRRMRRKSHEDVAYAMNYPSHAVPEHMYVATGPPNASWRAMPPKPDEIRVRRYATGVDDRNFFTVLEYKINDQPIIWDYYTGYVHLTGIWKAIGHAKADIVKLLDNSPELEPIIKRVRGGFLKIQGTWVPYDVAHRLAKHICYYVRYALVPMFGPQFPDECTKPDEPGFGELHLNQPYAHLVHAAPASRPKHAAAAATAAAAGLPAIAPATAAAPASAASASAALAGADAPPASTSAASSASGVASGAPQAHAKHRSPPLHTHSSSFSHKPTQLQRPLLGSGRHTHHHSESHAMRPRRESGGRPRASSGPHQRSDSFNSIRRAIESQRVRVDTSVETGSQSLVIDAVDEETYDENVFDDDEPLGSISPPPMPRKLSFRDEQRVSESPSEFIEMLKATRSLQQMSAGRRLSEHWNRTGGGFECAGRQFRWDGSDHLEVIMDSPKLATQDMADAHAKKRELTPPSQPDKSPSHKPQPDSSERRLPSLAKILNTN